MRFKSPRKDSTWITTTTTPGVHRSPQHQQAPALTPSITFLATILAVLLLRRSGLSWTINIAFSSLKTFHFFSFWSWWIHLSVNCAEHILKLNSLASARTQTACKHTCSHTYTLSHTHPSTHAYTPTHTRINTHNLIQRRTHGRKNSSERRD